MLPDGWKDWKTCIEDNLYACLGLSPEETDYEDDQIKNAYLERYEWFQKRGSSKNSPMWEGKFDFAVKNLQRAYSVLTNKEEKKKYDDKLKKKGHERKIKTLIDLVITPAIEKDRILTPEEEENIILASRRLGLADAECNDIINDALKKSGAKRAAPSKATVNNVLELFRDVVYLAIEDGWLEPKEKRHLLTETTKKFGVSEDDAKAIIIECLKERGAKEGTLKKSDLPEELQGKTYYEIFRISEKASTIEIEDAYKNQFNIWNSRASNPKYTPYVRAVKDFLLEAKNTLLDPTKKQQYDESLKVTSDEIELYTKPPGTPKLEIWDETGTEKRSFEFKNMRMGVPKSFNVTAKNGGGGILNADVNTTHPWLSVDTNKIQHSKLPQNLTITVDPSKDKSCNHFGAEGNGYIEISYQKGSLKETERINVSFSIEIPEIALNRFKNTFIPLTAAIFGFIGSLIKGNNLWGLAYISAIPFGIWYKMQYISEQGIKKDLEIIKQIAFGILIGVGGLIVVAIFKAIFQSLPHFSGFLIGASVFGIASYLLSKIGLEFSLNKGIDISKFPPIAFQGMSIALVVLAIIVHSGGGSVVKKASYTPAPTPAPVPAPAPAPKIPLINITKAFIAAGLDTNQVPFGVNTSFPSENKRLYYYVSYNGAIPDRTVFIYKWYKYGNIINETQFTLKYAAGNAWNYFDYDFQPGQYEVQLYAYGKQLDRRIFSVNASSADTRRAEEQQRQQEAERQRREAENLQRQQQRQLEKQQRAEERQRQQMAERERREAENLQRQQQRQLEKQRRAEERQRQQMAERERREAENLRRQQQRVGPSYDPNPQRRSVEPPSRPLRSDGWQKSRESVTYEDK